MKLFINLVNEMVVLLLFCLYGTVKIANADCVSQKITTPEQVYLACLISEDGTEIRISSRLLSGYECESACNLLNLSRVGHKEESRAFQVINVVRGAMKLIQCPVNDVACFRRLQEGNRQFVEGCMHHTGLDGETRNKLAGGQSPEIIFFGCMDSRVVPEFTFDLGLGDTFAIRNAGHVVNDDVLGSIEFAIIHFKIKTIVVKGHEACGAIKATLMKPENVDAGSPALNSMMNKIRPAIKLFSGNSSKKEIELAVRSHTHSTVVELLGKSSIIRNAVIDGKVNIIAAYYHLDGRVDFSPLSIPEIDVHHIGDFISPK